MALTHAVLGGGAMHGFMYLGALMALFGNSQSRYATWRRGLRSIAGTSIGALIAFLLTLWDPWRVLAFLKGIGFQSIEDTLFNQNWAGLTTQKSVNSGIELDKLLRRGIADSAGDADATFADVHARTGVTLVVTVTCSSNGRTQYWSHVNKPAMPVWQALRASVSLPYVFPHFAVDGLLYIDGGITCNVPCHLFPPGETLVLYVQARAPAGGTALGPSSLFDVYTNAAQLGSFRAEPLYALNSIPCVPAADSVSPYNFGATGDALDALVAQGIRSVHAVFLRNRLLLYTVQLVLHFWRRP